MNSLYNLLSGVDLFYSKFNNSIGLYIKTGVYYFKLPKFYYIFINDKIFNIIVFNKSVFYGLLLGFFNLFKIFNVIRLVKLRIRGLGYEIRECTLKIHSFCFNWINYIYLFTPLSLLLKCFKKRFILLSSNDLF